MLNLREYAARPKLLADYLPWAVLVAPGVILNKDGSFQTSYQISRAGSGKLDGCRTCGGHSAGEQCAAPVWQRLGALL